jgi:hypothetical protein
MPSKSCKVTVDLGAAPRVLVEFRSGGAAVEVSPDQLGVAAHAIVLAGHLLNSFVRNSESRRERLFARYQQKYQQNGPLQSVHGSADVLLPRIFTRVFNAPRKFSQKNQESN